MLAQTDVDDQRPDQRNELPSLEEVRRAIPANCYQRSMGRGLLLMVTDVLLYAAAVGLAVRSNSLLGGMVAALLVGLTISALFVLGHDAAHDALLPSRHLNRLVALVFMLPSLHVRDGWVFGHNRVHHGFTVRRGVDFVWHPVTPQEYREMSRRQQFVHRLDWSWAGAGPYYLRNVWWSKMIRFTPANRSAPGIRRDRRIVVGFVLAMTAVTVLLGWRQDSTVLSALWMWARVLIIPFLVFTWVIGATVHIHHVQADLKWYDGNDWTRSKAQLVGTTVMRAPWLIDVALHHIFVHVPHHVDARIPCYRLSQAADAIDSAFPGVIKQRSFHLRDYFRATRDCKLFDFANSRWIRIAEAV